MPADDGGMGMTAVELVITLEELGPGGRPDAVPGHDEPVRAARARVRRPAPGRLRRDAAELLGAVCAGGTGAAAFAADAVHARRDGDGWVLDGTARHVVDGDRADQLAVVAAHRRRASGVFVVPAGVGRAPPARPRSTGRSTSRDVALDGVAVAADRAVRRPRGRRPASSGRGTRPSPAWPR